MYLVICQMELDKHCSDPESARCLLLIYQHLKRHCLHLVSRLHHLGSRLQTLLTASEEREVTQHVYELMEAEVELQEEGREALLKEIGDNPRCVLATINSKLTLKLY